MSSGRAHSDTTFLVIQLRDDKRGFSWLIIKYTKWTEKKPSNTNLYFKSTKSSIKFYLNCERHTRLLLVADENEKRRFVLFHHSHKLVITAVWNLCICIHYNTLACLADEFICSTSELFTLASSFSSSCATRALCSYPFFAFQDKQCVTLNNVFR